ncbi:hypothetical protein OIU79_023314 [Salix purpurea]|uniref:Uncharacterized protein n=1 Tax=Salix purpurea TaxID=77065 RepID=A0A9Q0W8V3_SALPP|nr:hypothetical protein OIU79_023314 [Salix purpurea]
MQCHKLYSIIINGYAYILMHLQATKINMLVMNKFISFITEANLSQFFLSESIWSSLFTITNDSA